MNFVNINNIEDYACLIQQVLLVTTLGDIDVELWSKEAPMASRNFVQLCMEGYYNGTIFHRIIKGNHCPSCVGVNCMHLIEK